MKFWKRWIADIQTATMHLSLTERGAYGDLLDHYYEIGGPLPGDHISLYRLCRAFDKTEQRAIDKILGIYFHKTEMGLYLNRRAEEEIAHAAKYSQEQSERSALAHQARWGKKEAKEKTPRINGAAFHPPEWIVREQWDSWVAIRPAKARTPASLAAACAKLEKFKAAGHDPNAIVANSLANGWQGLFVPDQKSDKLSLSESNRLAGEEAQRRFEEEQRNAGK